MHQKSVIFAIIGKSFNYKPYLCNGCHDLMQKTMNFNDVTIVSIKGNDYRIHFWYMNRDDAINMMKKSDLKKLDQYKIFWLYIKNVWSN